ncbi:cyclic nucleotide-gated ion channel 1 [Tanacetum coccineum]
MSHHLLPNPLKERIRRYEQYKWQETRAVDEDSLIWNLLKDLRRYIKRHLSVTAKKGQFCSVTMFEKMDDQLMDAMCDFLKPVLYTENSYIVRDGDLVKEMLFVMRGKLLTVTTIGLRTGFFNSDHKMACNFCGEELLTWALDPHTSSNLPISTRTVQALEEVAAFALMADDLKFVASQGKEGDQALIINKGINWYTSVRIGPYQSPLQKACKEDGDYVLGTSMEVKVLVHDYAMIKIDGALCWNGISVHIANMMNEVRCEESKVSDKSLEIGSND